MDLSITKAVLHILDTNVDAPVVSEYLLESEDALAYLSGIAARAFNGEETKLCTLPAEAPLAAKLSEVEEDFLPATVHLAEQWFQILTENPSIPAGDAAFALLSIDGKDYFAAFKLNYKIGVAHYFELRGSAAANDIVRQATMLPGASGKADEAFFIELSLKAPYHVRLLEKKYDMDGHKQPYLGRRLLEVRPGLSPKEKLETIRSVAVEVNQQFYGATGVDEPEVAAAVCAEYKAAKVAASRPDVPWEPAPIEDLCDTLYGDLPHAREAFTKALAERDIALDEPLPMPAAAVRRLEKQSLRSAGGVEVKVPVEVYRDESALEFIKNPDGTTSLLIKNILV